MDIKNEESVWLQITAGQGPKECAWVVSQILKCVVKEGAETDLSIDLVESLAYDKTLRKQNLIEPDALLSALLKVTGVGANYFAKRWEGSIKWHGESPFRPKHKRLNWFVGVVLLNSPISNSIDWQKVAKEVTYESMRASGPGGQHVNKTSSAVRLIHKPTGTQIRVQTDRSQHRNKQLAMERLIMILQSKQDDDSKNALKDRWMNHYQVGRGNPVRTFIGNEFKEKR